MFAALLFYGNIYILKEVEKKISIQKQSQKARIK